MNSNTLDRSTVAGVGVVVSGGIVGLEVGLIPPPAGWKVAAESRSGSRPGSRPTSRVPQAARTNNNGTVGGNSSSKPSSQKTGKNPRRNKP